MFYFLLSDTSTHCSDFHISSWRGVWAPHLEARLTTAPNNDQATTLNMHKFRLPPLSVFGSCRSSRKRSSRPGTSGPGPDFTPQAFPQRCPPPPLHFLSGKELFIRLSSSTLTSLTVQKQKCCRAFSVRKCCCLACSLQFTSGVWLMKSYACPPHRGPLHLSHLSEWSLPEPGRLPNPDHFKETKEEIKDACMTKSGSWCSDPKSI